MLIKPVPAFDFAGKLYIDERKAIEAALTEIATQIVKQHATAPITGITNHADDLIELLVRRRALISTDQASEEAPTVSTAAQEDPAGE